ncbi:MAG: hypothetical protein JST26_13310 [Bacteroidetes bacterium]|nr:hypothetical protein [Bacteroidota bacterium]
MKSEFLKYQNLHPYCEGITKTQSKNLPEQNGQEIQRERLNEFEWSNSWSTFSLLSEKLTSLRLSTIVAGPINTKLPNLLRKAVISNQAKLYNETQILLICDKNRYLYAD